MTDPGSIKVCPDPHCEAIWHHTPQSHTKCNNCDGRIIRINEETFWRKFSNKWFQYDFITGDYYRPEKEVRQLYLDFAQHY